MLLAIDVGNTHTVFGVWDGASWAAVWRRGTNPAATEDQLAVWLQGAFLLSKIEFKVDGVVCASVVPPANDALDRLSRRWFGIEPFFIHGGADLGLEVHYDPPTAVGADRLANALAALEQSEPPIIVVDFGTATTFDAISADGAYAGGAIMPGVAVSTQALVSRTAQLPQIEFVAPPGVLGRSTAESLRSGVMHGYAGAIDHLTSEISRELGGKPKVIATGGLGRLFVDLCSTIECYRPNLTLDGLRIAYGRLSASP
jgi:type III pantothenate kinase